MTTKVSLKVTSYSQLRDTLHHSGLFDMADCTISLTCPASASTDEIDRMVHVIESAINVVDVKITVDKDPYLFEYLVDLYEVPADAAKGTSKS
jgi:hypothetical protein